MSHSFHVCDESMNIWIYFNTVKQYAGVMTASYASTVIGVLYSEDMPDSFADNFYFFSLHMVVI